jgi:hypothetical protein
VLASILVSAPSPSRSPALAALALAALCSACGDETLVPTGTSSTTSAPPGVEPLTGDKEIWSWVPFDDAFCADGNPTGLAVNLSDRGDDAVIFLAGGGACWDYKSCYESGSATYVQSGFVESDMPFLTLMATAVGLLNRDDPKNPFRNDSLVALPYCTGDAFSGDHVSVYEGRETHHVGHANVLAYLPRIVATFPKAKRITLVGVSAGGMGAVYNWWHVQKAFGDIRVDVINDSGAAMPPPYLKEEVIQKWQGAWDLYKGLPPECTECKTHLDAIVTWSAAKLTKSRGAFLSYTTDTAIPYFFDINDEEFRMGLDALVEQRLQGEPRLRYFFAEGKGHVLMPFPKLEQSGVRLWDWIPQMVNDDPSWESVHP